MWPQFSADLDQIWRVATLYPFDGQDDCILHTPESTVASTVGTSRCRGIAPHNATEQGGELLVNE